MAISTAEMPITFQLDVPRRLIVARAYGDVNFAQVCDYFRDLQAQESFQPHFSELMDLHEVAKAGLTAIEIAELAKIPVFDPAARRALVVKTKLMYGLCRMFAAHCSFWGEHRIGVFHHMDEARHWLGLDDKPHAESLLIAS